MRKTTLLIALLLVCCVACRDQVEVEVSPCGYCPNNTTCLEDECGCPPDQIDMGSWCMRKYEGLFVAKDMLGCPCFEPFGLVLFNIEPELPGTVISTSLYSIEARETYLSAMTSNFAYYERPGGDSISIFAMALPKELFPNTCRFSSTQECMAHLGGRFVGPDSIRAEIRWILCTDSQNKPEPYRFWLVRQP